MAKPQPHQTKPEDRVSLSEKITYALGAVPLGTGMQVINRMSDIVFNMCLGVSPALIGTAMFIFRMWDAVTDPIMGSISDNTRWKWGRRRPFLVLGSVLCAIVFPLIWMVGRDWSKTVIFGYYLVFSLIFYTCYTIFSVPYLSLATEMTPDYHERTRIISMRALFNKFVAIGTGWLFSLVTLSIFKDELHGMRWLSWGISLLFIVFGILPALFTKERFQKQASQQQRTSLIQSIKITMSSRPYLLLLSMVILMVLAAALPGGLGLYLNVYYVCAADRAAAALMIGYGTTGAMIASIISIPIYTALSRRLGKTTALKINLWFFLVANLLNWVLVNPDHPSWLVINYILQGPAITGVWILLPSMQTDICDWDELNTGRRREGSYSSVMSWINKTGLSLASLISGIILVSTGFNVAFGAEQPANTFLMMRILYFLLPTAANILILFILQKYPLTEQRCHEIRAELEARRGTV